MTGPDGALPRVRYAREPTLAPEEFRHVLVGSGLGATRPVADDRRLAAMLAGSSLILTARSAQAGAELVGVARCVTDFAWCCYLSELAVVRSWQGHGIGRGLLEAAGRELGPGVSLILVAYPEAAGFYERAGMTRIPDAFWHRRSA